MEIFEDLSELGAGGFATTYKARVSDQHVRNYIKNEFKHDSELVAIKIPLSRETEIALMQGLKLLTEVHKELHECKSIVKYLGHQAFRGTTVMVMELVKDGSLRRLMGPINGGQRIEPKKAISLLVKILEGLKLVHECRIMHRDIKPENVLMDGSMPKIADFDIGQMVNDAGVGSSRIGTLLYTPPEIFHGIEPQFNMDLWALGIMAYEMLCGTLPFGMKPEGVHFAEIIEIIKDAKLRVQFPGDLKLPDDVKRDVVERIICRLLERSPRMRYQSATEVLNDLRNLPHIADEQVEEKVDAFRDALEDRTKSDLVEKNLNKLAVLYPDSARVYLYLGRFHNFYRAFRKAVDSFSAGLEKNPNDPQLHWGLAMAWENLKRKDKAIEATERALELGLGADHEKHARMFLDRLKGGSGK